MENYSTELYEKSKFILEYLKKVAKENNEPVDLLNPFLATLEKTYSDNNSKGLEIIFKDYVEWAKGIPLTKLKELENQFEEKFNVGLFGN